MPPKVFETMNFINYYIIKSKSGREIEKEGLGYEQ